MILEASRNKDVVFAFTMLQQDPDGLNTTATSIPPSHVYRNTATSTASQELTSSPRAPIAPSDGACHRIYWASIHRQEMQVGRLFNSTSRYPLHCPELRSNDQGITANEAIHVPDNVVALPRSSHISAGGTIPEGEGDAGPCSLGFP